MMVGILILVGLGLVACGIIIACLTVNNSNKNTNVTQLPPPLPPRVNMNAPTPIVSHPQARANNTFTPRPLPPRRSSASNGSTQRIEDNGCGPRGIKPAQFPCCPFDKLRNVPGERQVIFWNSGTNCYRCSRGHVFNFNGKLL